MPVSNDTKLAAQSIPQFFSKLRATVFFAAFFLKRKRVLLKRVLLKRVLFKRVLFKRVLLVLLTS